MTGVITLALDASTYVGSVAVLRGASLIAEREVAMRGREAERLMPATAEALAEAGIAPAAVERVVCGGGPGSFTSLRIAGAIAKGIALSASCPLYAVPSLLLMAAAARPPLPPGRVLACLDAMRDEVYAAVVGVPDDGAAWTLGDLRLAAADAVEALAAGVGEGVPTLGPGRRVDALPLARGVARLAAWLDAASPVPLDGWEPAYGRLAEAQVRWEAAHGRALPGG